MFSVRARSGALLVAATAIVGGVLITSPAGAAPRAVAPLFATTVETPTSESRPYVAAAANGNYMTASEKGTGNLVHFRMGHTGDGTAQGESDVSVDPNAQLIEIG